MKRAVAIVGALAGIALAASALLLPHAAQSQTSMSPPQHLRLAGTSYTPVGVSAGEKNISSSWFLVTPEGGEQYPVWCMSNANATPPTVTCKRGEFPK